MPDNVLNAMRGLTEYLMKENQLLDIKRKEEKVNTAAERISEAYQNLPPSASLDDIQNLGFRAIEDAAALGTIKEVMPLINQMNQSTMAMYQIRKGEASSNAARELMSKWTKQEFDSRLSGQDAVNLTQVATALNPPQQTKTAEGTTEVTTFNLDGSVKSTRVIDAFGIKEQQTAAMDMFKQQKAIEHSYTMKEINARGSWNMNTALAGVPGDVEGKVKWGWAGANGETLYTNPKGAGAYTRTPDGKYMYYQGKMKKVDEATQKEEAQTQTATFNAYQPKRKAAYDVLYEEPGGEKLILSLTGQWEVKANDKDIPDPSNYDVLGSHMDRGDWKEFLKSKIEELKDDDETINAQRLFDLVKLNKDLDYNMRKATQGIQPPSGSNNDPKVIPKKLGIDSWNKGQRTIADVFNRPGQEKRKNDYQYWISQQLGGTTPSKFITYDDYTKLDSTVQVQFINLIMEADSLKNAKGNKQPIPGSNNDSTILRINKIKVIPKKIVPLQLPLEKIGGFKWGWVGENGQLLYVDEKGAGAYTRRSDGKYIPYQGKMKSEEDWYNEREKNANK